MPVHWWITIGCQNLRMSVNSIVPPSVKATTKLTVQPATVTFKAWISVCSWSWLTNEQRIFPPKRKRVFKGFYRKSNVTGKH